MGAAKKQSAKPNNEISEDVQILQRRWRAAVRTGANLPSYEDVLLGSLGRLADHIVLLKCEIGAFAVSRAGRYAREWLGNEGWGVPMPDCATVLNEAASNAIASNRPYLTTAHCVRDGIVRAYDVLALPTLSRWGGMLVGVYVNERGTQYNLLDAMFSTTGDGVIVLSPIRDATGRPSDFQIVHHNPAAARLLNVAEGILQWQRLSNGRHLLCLEAVVARLHAALANSKPDQFEIDSDGSSLRLRITPFGNILSLAISDITTLKRREASFRLLFDSNPMPMCVVDRATMAVLTVNDAALGPVIADMEKLTGVEARRIHVDKGYRGHNHPHRFRFWISGQVRRVTAPIRREMRRRAAVEPVIGHIKAEHRMDRNYLKGRPGDCIDAVLAAAGYNFGLLLRWLSELLRAIIRAFLQTIPAPNIA
ncbi:PAS domain-containing protein [Bradyrhizobium sp. USDA 4454]